MSVRPAKALRIAAPERRHRRHPRYRASFPVEVTILTGSQYERRDGHCRDLSEAGIGILLATELAPSDVVSLKFSLPDSGCACELRAVLRHRRGYQYGFEFLSLPLEIGEALKNYLRSLERAD